MTFDRIFLAAAVAALAAVLAGYRFEPSSNPAARRVLSEIESPHPSKHPGRVPYRPAWLEWNEFEARPWSATFHTHVTPKFIPLPPPPPRIDWRLADLSIVAEARVEGTALSVALGSPPEHEAAYAELVIERRVEGGEWRHVHSFEPQGARSFEHFDAKVEPRAVYEYRVRGRGRELARESGTVRAEIPWNFRVVLIGNYRRPSEHDYAIVQVSKYDHAHRAWFGPVEYRVHAGDRIGVEVKELRDTSIREVGGAKIDFATGLTVVELRGFTGGGRHEMVCRRATGETVIFQNKR